MQKASKLTAMVLVLVMVSSTGLTGCSTTKAGPTPLQYSFAEPGAETAAITFVYSSGWLSDEIVYFVDFEGKQIPAPASGTYWTNTMHFPAGEPFTLNVYVVRDRKMIVPEMLDGMGNVPGEAGIFVLIIAIPLLVFLPFDAIAAGIEDRFKYVDFVCPPLEAGEEYKLEFDYLLGADDKLILKKVVTKQQGTLTKKTVKVDETVYEQIFQATLREKDKSFVPSYGRTTK